MPVRVKLCQYIPILFDLLIGEHYRACKHIVAVALCNLFVLIIGYIEAV